MLGGFSHVQLFATLWAIVHQSPLSTGCSRSGLPFPSPGDLPNAGIEPPSLMSPALAGGFFTTSATWEASLLVAATAKSLQSCPTLSDPIDGSPPGSRPWDSSGKNTGVRCHCLLQCVKVKSLSCVRLLATPWTAAYQAPPSMGFSRQEYWSGVPLPLKTLL